MSLRTRLEESWGLLDMKYKTYRLGDVVNIFDKKRVPLSSMQRAERQGKYRYFGAQGVIDYVDDYIFEGIYLLIAEDGENLKSKKQNVAQIVSGKFWVNNHAHILQAKEEHNIYYLGYLINSIDLSGYITGSAQPKLSQTNLNAIALELPDKRTQDKIASVLQAFDNKIDLNNEINNNLEQQAQAIYQRMFIDNASSDWEEGTLSDIADITMGQSPSGSSYNEDGNGTIFFQGRAEFGFRFPTVRLYTTEPKRMACTNDTLMSVRAPVGDLNVAHVDCCIGRGLAAIHSKNNHQSFVLYTMFSLKKQLDVFNGEGTVFGSINRNSLNDMPLIIPSSDKLDEFEALVAPMDAAIRNNYDEICRLEQLRDSLLPKLMSGELDVSDIEL